MVLYFFVLINMQHIHKQSLAEEIAINFQRVHLQNWDSFKERFYGGF